MHFVAWVCEIKLPEEPAPQKGVAAIRSGRELGVMRGAGRLATKLEDIEVQSLRHSLLCPLPHMVAFPNPRYVIP